MDRWLGFLFCVCVCVGVRFAGFAEPPLRVDTREPGRVPGGAAGASLMRAEGPKW